MYLRISTLIKILAPDAKEDELPDLEVDISLDDEIFAANYLIDKHLSGKMLVGFHAGSRIV